MFAFWEWNILWGLVQSFTIPSPKYQNPQNYSTGTVTSKTN